MTHRYPLGRPQLAPERHYTCCRCIPFYMFTLSCLFLVCTIVKVLEFIGTNFLGLEKNYLFVDSRIHSIIKTIWKIPFHWESSYIIYQTLENRENWDLMNYNTFTVCRKCTLLHVYMFTLSHLFLVCTL